ncbi:MAG: ABC transporter ATP-binding protein [Deltaproteobacteria bacterium]|jgi:branched-chain amino acid transport system ATP-binding protein/urea transport system ATP-binding protein|nr:ABC transporter ATP-binding protein [Deltaproteobacteria bacterium]
MLNIDCLHSAYIRGANILKNLSFHIKPGELVAVMGRNGMGKTTLVKTIIGLMPYLSGDIRFLEEKILGRKSYEISNLGVAYVPQGREIFKDFTVEQNLLLGVLGKKKKVSDFDLAYQHFPILAERRKQLAGTMSGGQQQQLAIARAIIGKPKLLLLDEPSEGIQPNIVHEIAATLKQISATESLTILLIEQNLELVTRLVDRVDFIENGQIVHSVDVKIIHEDPELVARFMSV